MQVEGKSDVLIIEVALLFQKDHQNFIYFWLMMVKKEDYFQLILDHFDIIVKDDCSFLILNPLSLKVLSFEVHLKDLYHFIG